MRTLAVALIVPFLCNCSTIQGGGNLDQYGVSDVTSEASSTGNLDAQIENSSRSIHSYLVGQLAFAEQDFKRAERAFEDVVKSSDRPAPQVSATLAELYLRSGQVKKALAAAQQATDQDPKNVIYKLLSAGIYEALSQDDQALEIYKTIIADNPANVEAVVLYASLEQRRGNRSLAIGALEKLSVLASQDSTVWVYLGHAYENADNLPSAERAYSKALEVDRNKVAFHVDLIRVLLKARKLVQAKQSTEHLLSLDPENVIGRKLMGELLINEKDYDSALSHLERLKGVDTEALDARFKIALIHFERRNYDQAIREFSVLLAKEPKRNDVRYLLGSAFAASGRNSESLEELQKISKESKHFVQSRVLAAFVARQSSKLEDALGFLKEAHQVDSDNIILIEQITQLLRELKSFEPAKQFLSEQLERQPDNERLLLNLGMVLQQLGQSAESITVVSKILDKNPSSEEALNFVAYGLAEEGRDLERALLLVNRALTSSPGNGYYLDTRGWIYFKSGQLEMAERDLKRATQLASDDGVLIEHYADVLLARQKQLDAYVAYRRAKEACQSSLQANANDLEQENALSRIKEKLIQLEQQNPKIIKLAERILKKTVRAPPKTEIE